MNKHETDVFSLAFGLVFLVIAATWVIGKMIQISWISLGWVLAGGLVLIGLLGIFSAVRPSRSR